MYAKEVERIIIIKANCCRLSQIVKVGTQNCANNKEIDLKLNTNLYLFYLQSTNSYF